jgi:mannitol-1-phosphate/altronate dehydrogenase
MSGVAVHFGAGNIGRGFVGLILHRAGYEVVFADVVDALIDALSSTPSFLVKEVGLDSAEELVDNYRAINSRSDEPAAVAEIASADVVTMAVGPTVLKFVAPVIAAGLREGTAQIVSLPEAMAGLVDYYRRISGEHPDWDDYRRAMQHQHRVLVRVSIDAVGPAHTG